MPVQAPISSLFTFGLIDSILNLSLVTWFRIMNSLAALPLDYVRTMYWAIMVTPLFTIVILKVYKIDCIHPTQCNRHFLSSLSKISSVAVGVLSIFRIALFIFF